MELKKQKERLQKTCASYWNEPIKELINTLEIAEKTYPFGITSGRFGTGSKNWNEPPYFRAKLFRFQFLNYTKKSRVYWIVLALSVKLPLFHLQTKLMGIVTAPDEFTACSQRQGQHSV